MLEVPYKKKKKIIALHIIRTLKKYLELYLLQQDNDKLSKIHQWHLINNLFIRGFTVLFKLPYA